MLVLTLGIVAVCGVLFGFGQRWATMECTAETQRRERREDYTGVAATAGKATVDAATQTERIRSRTCAVQGPVTYARHRVQPRFVPLPDISWGVSPAFGYDS